MFISIHTPHAGSDDDEHGVPFTHDISIHTPHAGSDLVSEYGEQFSEISIHTPHAGSDEDRSVILSCQDGFQSTLPMRGVTE